MRLLRDPRGGSAVEFALILPVLVLILFGIIEFSLIMYDKAVITNASREGARQGIVYRVVGNEYTPLSPEEIQTAVEIYLNRCGLYGLKNPQAPVVTVVPPSDPPPSPEMLNMLTVRVSYTYNFLIVPNIPGVSLANSVNLVSETIMRMEPED